MEEDTKNLHPIEVLIEELKCEDISRRVISVKSLNTIAIALGPKQTREELLPYLLELLDDENEVLLALADSLKHLLHSIGGRKFAYALFDLTENLLQIDEASIRLATLNSFSVIIKQSHSPLLSKVVLDLIQRLCSSEKIPSKIAAAYLIPCSMDRIEDIAQHIYHYKQLMLCSHPQVRTAAAENMKLLVGYKDYIAELLNIATVDQEDSVRLLALEALLLCDNVKGLITSVTALFEDDYWKVKQKIAENLSVISKFINNKYSLVYEYFKRVISDKEIEVRLALCQHVSEIIFTVPDQDKNKYLELLPLLSNDSIQIKSALASQIDKIWGYVGKNQVLSEVIKTITYCYTSQVSLNLLQNIQNFRKFDQEFSETIKNQFLLLSKDKNWRIRKSFIISIKNIVESLDSSFFLEYLKEFVLEFIVDSVFSVRESAAALIRDLVEILGTSWIEENMLEDLFTLQYSKNYIFRMSYISVANLLFPLFIRTKTEDRIEKSIFLLLGDNVCNVRAYALKALVSIYSHANLEKQLIIKNSLSVLQEDDDTEIKNMVATLF
jgi:serine/threonine-protein phosphatase 2A regulatory subunit A